MVEIHLTQRPYIRWKHESLSSPAIGWIALAVSTLSGSTFAAFSKFLSAQLSALSLLFVSELLSALFVLFSFGFFPVLKSLLNVGHKRIPWLIVTAMFSGIGGPLLWFIALRYTTALNAAFFAKSEMIVLMLLAVFVLHERFTKTHVPAIMSVLAGVVIISLHGLREGLSFHSGDLLVVGSVMCYAAGNVTFRAKLHGIEPHIVLFCRSIAAISTFFFVSPFIQHPFISEVMVFPLTMIPALFGFAFVARFLNSTTYYVAIDRLPVSTVSLISTLDIIGATFFAFLYLGEAIEWYHYVGGAFIILGNVLLELLGTHPTDEHLEEHLKQRLP